jgi:hypothetical protein
MSSFIKLCDDVKAALKLWHEPAEVDFSPLDYLHLFQETQLKNGDSARQVTHDLLLAALSNLAVEYGPDADLLRRHFLEGQSMRTIGEELHLSSSTAYRYLEQATSSRPSSAWPWSCRPGRANSGRSVIRTAWNDACGCRPKCT